MEVIYKNPKELKFYDNKLRVNYKSVQLLIDSIKEFGFVNPILTDKANVIISGEARVLASISLDLEKIPCITIDKLTDEQIKAYRIIDNQINESSWWNHKNKHKEVNELKINLIKFGLPEEFHSCIDIDEFFEEKKIEQVSLFDLEEDL